MDKKRIFNTKNYKNRIIVNLILIILCFIYFEFVMRLLFKQNFFYIKFININFTLFSAVNSPTGLLNSIFILLIELTTFILMFLLFTFPVNIICLAIRKAYLDKLKQSVTYQNTLDISYYRNILSDITPGELSVIIDYKTESKKDITATLMKLYQNKYIDFQDNNIVILNSNCTNLKESEKYVLTELINNKNYNNISSTKFHKTALNEALEGGYLINKRDKKFLIRKLLILLGLFIICTALNKSDYNSYISSKLDTVSISMDIKFNENVLPEDIINDSIIIEYSILMICFFFIGLAAFGVLLIPLYAFIYFIFFKISQVKYKRTKNGNELLELIAGLKNFIHDFTNLSDREKEEIVLWEDFLVYAIVLEENDKIVKDIMKFKNINVFFN